MKNPFSSILDRLQTYIVGWFGKNNSANSLIPMTTVEVYPDVTQKAAIDQGYQSNAAVNAIVSKSAKKFASIPRYLCEVPKEKTYQKGIKYFTKAATIPQFSNQSALQKLLNNPSSGIGQDQTLAKIYTAFKVCGEAFIYLNRGDTTDASGNPLPDEAIDKMLPIEWVPINPQLIYLVPDPTDMNGVLGYELDLMGVKKKLRKNDIIHWKNVNLSYDVSNRTYLRGLSPLTPGFKSLQANNAASKAIVRMHDMDGARGVMYADTDRPLDLSAGQADQIRSVINQRINNNDVKGAISVLEGKWGYLNFGATAVDMQLIEGKEASWKELCAIFDIPYELFQSNTTYANKEEAQKGWVNNVIVPDSKQLDDELNRVLLPIFGLQGKVAISCDYTCLPELQDDLKDMASALAQAWWMTPNQRLIQQGLEPYADPSFDIPFIPNNLIPLNQVTAEFDQINNNPSTDNTYPNGTDE